MRYLLRKAIQGHTEKGGETMALFVRFSDLSVGEEFFYVKSGRRTRFRKIAPLKLGEAKVLIL